MVNKEIIWDALNFSSLILGLGDKCVITFEDEKYFPTIDVSASTTNDKVIHLNKNWLELCDNRLSLYSVIFHESRHVYQIECINNNNEEDNTTLVLWKKELEVYIEPGKHQYLKQHIEIDAIAYTYFLMEKMFGVKTVIPDLIKNEVLIRYEEIKKKLSSKIDSLFKQKQ